MTSSPISALSPLDGRYANKLNALRPLMSELGYMHRRVQVEIAWFIALSDAGFEEFKPLSVGARRYLTGLVTQFSEQDALAIKDIEKTTNHDVRLLSIGSSPNSKTVPNSNKHQSLCILLAPARTSTTPAMPCSSRARDSK
jgi:adenylosuccinate lyase